MAAERKEPPRRPPPHAHLPHAPLPDASLPDARLRQPLLLEAFLPYRLNVAAAEASEELARVYSRRFGLDVPGWRVLATLGQSGRATAKAVGAHSRMHKTKVSRAVLQLERRGWVERSANPADKREAFLSLTRAGEAAYREIVPLALAYQEELLRRLSAEQLRSLDGILAAFGAPALETPAIGTPESKQTRARTPDKP